MKQAQGFESILKQDMEKFLELRKSQGHAIRKERHILMTLDRYIKDHAEGGKNLGPELVEGWLASLPCEMNINTRIVYISHYSQFAKYLASLGYEAFIPERPVDDRRYIPYIFSEEELQGLTEAADEAFSAINRNGKHGAACFAVILRMLIGCGLRLNEVLLLDTADVDLDAAVIYIRSAKGNKDRLVPMHESLASVLAAYIGSGIPSPGGLLFPNRTGKAFSQTWARRRFSQALSDAGIEKPSLGRYERNICIHCLRHTFAVTSFRRLDQAGRDMYDEIPVLSAYMGHDRIYGTEKYLHMTAENSADILGRMEHFNLGIFPEVDE